VEIKVFFPDKLIHFSTLSRAADSRSTIEIISRLLRNTKVHYRYHKISSLLPLWIQKNPVHNVTRYFINIHFIIVTWRLKAEPE
jgi:hypothetical protein